MNKKMKALDKASKVNFKFENMDSETQEAIKSLINHLMVKREEKKLKKWLRNLVKKIDMTIIKGPYAGYVNKKGNSGLTGVVMIETSHIAMHVWDEISPALVQCDVYSCAEFSSSEVLMEFAVMEPTKIEHILLDRAEKIVTITQPNSIYQEGTYG